MLDTRPGWHGPVIPDIVIRASRRRCPTEALVARRRANAGSDAAHPSRAQGHGSHGKVLVPSWCRCVTAQDARTNAKAAGCQSRSARASPSLSDACKAEGLPLLPGVSTASEVMVANDAGYGFLKLFLAVAVGGVNLLKALSGPFPDVAFALTGGISLETHSFEAAQRWLGLWILADAAGCRRCQRCITRLAAEAAAAKSG